MDPVLKHAQALAQQTVQAYVPIEKRVAYVVSHGQTYATNGYTIRTQGIAQALNEHGLETLCFVRPGRPWSIDSAHDIEPEVIIKGVRYIHSRWHNDAAPGNDVHELEANVERLVTLFRVYRPAIVLAASNWHIGLPAWVAAQRLGLPFYYEVRGFWELSGAARNSAYEHTEAFKQEARFDTFVAQQAKKVFTLNNPMKGELVKRGVNASNIEIVPNGVSERPTITAPSPALKKKLGIESNDKVIGYVGTFSPYEGLDTLIEACRQLVEQGENIKLLLVGDDRPLAESSSTPKHTKNFPWLIQVGRVPHEEISSYYALVDTIVIPRKPLSVCELVPPMKVAEALAYGKRVVVSNLLPLVEYTEAYDCVTSFNADEVTTLPETLRSVLNVPLRSLVSISPASMLMADQIGPLIDALDNRGEPKSASNNLAQLQHGLLNCPERIELPHKTPIWHTVPVLPGQSLIIEAAVAYRNIKGPQNRKAVLLIRSFNSSGQEVEKACGNMVESAQLKAYFRYIPSTDNESREIHAFVVPEGVNEIRIGLCGFNIRSGEQVLLHSLQVRPQTEISEPSKEPSKYVPPSAQAAEISILGWPEYPPNGKPYVIGVMDEFTTGCFEHDVNLILPRPDNWYALAEKYRPAFFFIESAWKGNFGSWQYRVADYANKPGQEVAHLCQYAREKGIPTVFWNKEDPVHHEKFMCSARLAEHIFTTDANMRESYQAKTGNTKVYALPFAAQPALHKPAPLAGRKPRACFAGSWYGNRHAERGEAMRWLLQAANQYGLDIYDRNYGTGNFPFPEEYQAGIKGSLPYKELCDEYSRYRVFLNVNSVTNSPTMFSRRVFELMACGTPIVSTYSKGIEALFESDAVWMVHSQEEADEALRTLMTDDEEWRRRSLAGIREVFTKHTYAHRLNNIFTRLDIETRLPTDPAISLVAEANSPADIQALNQFARRQSYRHFQLGIACDTGLAPLAGSLSDNVTLLSRGQHMSWLTEQRANFQLAGWLNPQHDYGEHYLRDLVNARFYEPDASGWAKSLDWDRFAYEGEACMNGMLWPAAEFLKLAIDAHPRERITHPGIYFIDSDQFQSAGPVQQVVGGYKR